MKKLTLIAALAILAAIGLVPVAANAHDGPAVVATLASHDIQLATAVTTESGGYELAVLSAYLALPANYLESLARLEASNSLLNLNRTGAGERDDGKVASVRSGPTKESEHRARDVQRDDERA